MLMEALKLMANITITSGPEERHYRQSRNVELSTLKFIKDNTDLDWTGVTIVKSWTQLDKAENPIICALLNDTDYTRNELGDTAFRSNYIFTIDIFATSDGQRIDLSDYLLDILNPGWAYYEISQVSGANRTLVYTEAGHCRIDSIFDNTKVDLGAMGSVKDKYRQNIILSVTVGCNS